ncbi:MAG: PorV/PorQ family protein [Gemmatimonadales bacterium]|nr:PorV/PorQ family protein [Gemmatimonadales bacterium]
MVISTSKRIILLVSMLLVVGTALPVKASEIIRLFGEENVGTTSGLFLRIPVGARAVALGKAYSALASDGSAPFWNPAGIVRTPGLKNFFASHMEYAADIDIDYFAFHGRGQNFGLGLSMGTLRSGEILRTDEYHPNGTDSTFNANQFFMGLTLARAMTDRFSIGGTVKYFQENLDQFQIKTVLADMGIFYFLGWGDARVGFSVRNFGSDLKLDGSPADVPIDNASITDFQSFPAPTVGAFGTARTWSLGEEVNLLTTMDFSHPSDYKESFCFGSELGLRSRLFLRGGYETSRDEGGLSGGFGVQLKRKGFLIKVDYAFNDMGNFGGIHYVSVDLSPLFRLKDPDAWRRRSR